MVSLPTLNQDPNWALQLNAAITTVETLANLGVTNAAAAQSTANTGVANAATAQAAAVAAQSTANGKVSKAGGDVIQSAAGGTYSLTIKSNASQSVDHFRVQTSGGTDKLTIASDYKLYSTEDGLFYKNLQVGGGGSETNGSGVGILGIADAATPPSTNPSGGLALYSQAGVFKVIDPSGNISALSGSASARRTDLGLGGAAVLSVGTTAGTVAAGDDSRVVGAVQTTRQVIAGTGLTGGGTLAADRTLTVAYGTSSTTATVGNDTRVVNAVQNSGGSIIQPTATNVVPLVLKYIAGQSVNLFEWTTSGGTVLVFMATSGNVTFRTGAFHNGIFQVGGETSTAQDGVGVMGLTNATTVPTTNPTGGGILYAQAGALKWRGSSGTVTTIAPA